MLASFEFESFELPSMSTSFTKSLIRHLNDQYEKPAVFSVSDLHRAMINDYNKNRNRREETEVVPFFMKLNGAPQDCSILLRPLHWPSQAATNSTQKSLPGPLKVSGGKW